MPPTFGFHPAVPENDRKGQIAHSAAAVIEPQLVEGIVSQAMGQETLIIMTHQRTLEFTASIRIPMQHQKCQISRADIKVPKLPVEQKRGSLARARKKKVPRMSVPMYDRDRPLISKTHPWFQRRAEDSFVEFTIIDRQRVPECIDECGQMCGDALDHFCQALWCMEFTDRMTERRRLPPLSMDAR